MAIYIAAADGNLTAGATWAAVDSTSFLDSQANNTVLTTSPVASSTFTPGAITIDGIAVKVASRASSPSGTMTVDLFNSTGGAQVAGTAVTINVSDLPNWTESPTSTLCGIGWTFFMFAAPVLLLGATNYAVRASTSASTQVNLFRDGTANNWSRQLRTTTVGVAPTTGDEMFICGEWTAAATKTDRAVVMDSTAATDYGDANTTSLATFGISKGGTLTYGTTAATNYILRISGLMSVWREGTLNIGTTGTPIPRDSSGVLEFDTTASNQFGLDVFGNLTCQGLSRTLGNNSIWCLLNTDEAIAQTVLGVDTDTGWLSGDEIAISSTTRTASQHELRALSGNATATTLTVTAGLTNAHTGTAPTQAEVILLTRNVVIRAVGTTFESSLEMRQDSTIDLDWALIKKSGSTTKRFRSWHRAGTGLGTIAINNCAFWEMTTGLGLNTAGTDQVLGLTDCVAYRLGTGGAAIDITAAITTDITLSNLVFIGCGDSSGGTIPLKGVGASSILTNLRLVSGDGAGLTMDENGSSSNANELTPPSITNLVCHSNAGQGVLVRYGTGMRFTTGSIWRNNSSVAGLYISNRSAGFYGTNDVVFKDFTIFGNGSSDPINVRIDDRVGLVTFRSCTIASDTSFTSSKGVFLSTTTGPVRLENCNVGVVSGIFTTHSTADIFYPAFAAGSSISVGDLFLIDTTLGSTTEIANIHTGPGGTFAVRKQRHEGVAGANSIEWARQGVVARETVVFRTGSPSERLTPNVTTNVRLKSGVKRVSVASGESATVGVYVQKDGSYNGVQPRFIVKANPSLGLDDDQVIDTMAGGTGVWEQLTGTITPAATDAGVYEVYVDCTGTAGNVYVDDWSGTAA